MNRFLADDLLAQTDPYQSGAAHDVKLDLGLDIPKLRAGCMYFLWQAPEN